MNSRSVHERGWWAFTVVHHDDDGAIGARGLVGPGMSVEIGRDGGLFDPRTLVSTKVSRRHARVDCVGASPPRLTDLASRNGTWLNGRAVASELLAAGDIVRIGDVLIAIQPTSLELQPLVVEGVPMRSFAMRSFAATLETVASRVKTVRVLHEAHCGEKAVERILRALVAGTKKSPRIVRECVESVDRTEAHHDDREAVLVFPPLRERTEDLPELFREISRRLQGRAVRLHHRTALAMLRAPWPGNLAELETFVRTHCAAGPESEPVRLSDRALARLGYGSGVVDTPDVGAIGTSPPVGTEGEKTQHLRVAADGKWFALDGQPRVSLANRYVLARILGALAREYEKQPGVCLSTDDLIAAAWPGTRFVADAGANRLYVSLTTLRRMGLRTAIERDEDGYRLAARPDVRIEVMDTWIGVSP